ncbi:MAG: hypothetical protein FWH04_04015 [Oscillospiraceae bacterium]|nr:hypothetical protein [Oscillospiraceae bacterium]
MSANTYINLLAQAEKLRRHNRQGSWKTKERRKFGGVDRTWNWGDEGV